MRSIKSVISFDTVVTAFVGRSIRIKQSFEYTSATLSISKSDQFHHENMSVQYTAIFHGRKNDNFQMKILIFFLFLLKT